MRPSVGLNTGKSAERCTVRNRSEPGVRKQTGSSGTRWAPAGRKAMGAGGAVVGAVVERDVVAVAGWGAVERSVAAAGRGKCPPFAEEPN